MGYFSYYILSIALAIAIKNPLAAGVGIVFWLCRGFLPDPVVWFRTMGRIAKLKGDIAMNPANLIATRDLARLYVERKRPRRAIELIEQTRQRMADSTRHPQGSLDDAELLYQLGIAKMQSGDAEAALQPIVSALAIAPEVGRGDPYLVAANALMSLGRWEEAEDSLVRFIEKNTSSVEALVKLARARAKQKDAEGSAEAITQAKQTWRVLPSFLKRRQWPWFAAALLSSLWI